MALVLSFQVMGTRMLSKFMLWQDMDRVRDLRNHSAVSTRSRFDHRMLQHNGIWSARTIILTDSARESLVLPVCVL
jgi:hypothetical protein